jgi:von Willebrand factor type A domain
MSETTIVVIGISIFALALAIYALTTRNRNAIADASGQPAERWRGLKNSLRFMEGPLPISIALHALLLFGLLWGVHFESGRNLITVNFQSAGSGGSHGGGDELKQLNLPEMPLPEMTAPLPIERPVVATMGSTQAVAAATHYMRSISGGSGIGIGRGGGLGSGYGQGVGAGFGGFIGGLRKSGLDVVLVIDGTGSMKLIIEDVKERMKQLVLAIHRLVPTARIGIVVFGGRGEPIQTVAPTVSPDRLIAFLGNISAHDGGEWQEDTLGAVRTAVDRMGWRPYARKVIVLVGDTPPFDEDKDPVLQEVRQFHEENGAFNTVDVTVEEHERFMDDWAISHGGERPQTDGLPEFYQQTQRAYQAIAASGGGSWRSLTKDQQINQQVLILAFGTQWQTEVTAFGRGISSTGDR